MKERQFKLSHLAIDNKLTVYFFTIVLVIAGIISYISTPKESFPEVVFPYFSVSTIYPGTSPSDMENLVTRPIEQEIKSVKGIKEVKSNSIQDFSLIFIEFETGIDINQAYQDVKEAVDKAQSDLPTDLLDDPEVTKIDISEIPVLNINLAGDLGLVQKKQHAEELQDRIESLNEVTRVDIVGALDREFQINIDLYKMQAAGISFPEVSQKVKYENMTISSGLIDIGKMQRSLRITGEFSNVEELKNVLIREGIYLKDIAEVVDGFADRESYARLGGENVITLNVIKKTGQNLIEAIDKINVILADYKTQSPSNLIITTTGDLSTNTKNNLNNLLNTIILGFMIVVLVLMFFMGIDNALFVAIAIPLSMVIAFIIIYAIGFTMNMVVLMAFILVLGIVVDNSIVVVENIYRHFMNTPNLSIAKASKIGTSEVALSVFSGTLTTMAPFLPLAFWPGIMGEFMQYIPITLIITLAVSMLVAYVMNPVFAASFMKYRPYVKITGRERNIHILKIAAPLFVIALISYMAGWNTAGNLISFCLILFLLTKYIIVGLIHRFQQSFLPRMMNGYKKTLTFLLQGKRPYTVIVSTVILLFATFWLMGIKPPSVVLFPAGEPEEMYVYINMPAGTHIDVTDSVCRVVEQKVNHILGPDNPDVDAILSNVAVNAGEEIFQRTTQAKLAKVTILFKEYEHRTGPSTNTYLAAIREDVKDIAGAQISVSKQQNGPPVGKPINIEISGENFSKLIPITARLQNFIEDLNIAGIEELKTDIELNNPEIIVNIDRTKANKLGISTGQIGGTLRTALYGEDVSKYREGEDEYDIRVRLHKKYRNNLDALLSMNILTPGNGNGGHAIPLSAVADIQYSSSYGGIIRKDNKRVITLYSNVLTGYNANEIVERLKNQLENFEIENGYQYQFTGEQEDQAENAQFLMVAFFAALMLILIILVAQFNSIAKPIIIAVQILFSMIGVLLGTIAFDIDFSIVMTGMGIIAVAGIVVKNAIILIDYTDVLIEREGQLIPAIIEAGATRLTPVILTAASTILGLLPLAIGMNIDFQGLFTNLDPNIYFGGVNATFWKPLAWTIIFGLGFATFLTLGVVPSMYSILCKKSNNC